MKKIFAISGSTRKGSSNEAILNFIAKAYQDKIELELFKGIETLPHFNPDCTDDNLSEAVRAFRERILHADGVIICSPEYVFSLPGSLKNALEWCVSTTVFSGKATAIIVASSLGEKAFESLDLVLTTMEATIAEQSKLLISGVKRKVTNAGQIVDAETRSKIDDLMTSLLNNQNPIK